MNRIWYTYRGKQHEIRTKDQRRLLWSFSQSSNISLEANHKRMNAGKTHESSNTSPWAVSNPPNICWIPEDLQEFQETLSATQWRCSWALIAQPRASKLRPSAQKTCRFESALILFDFVCVWDVYMMCTCIVVVKHDGQFNFFPLTPRPRHPYLPHHLHFQLCPYAF